jgi:hypothetical protein
METVLLGILFFIAGLCAIVIGLLVLFSNAARDWFARWKYIGFIGNEYETDAQRALTRYFNGPVMVIAGILLVRIALSMLGWLTIS